MSDALDVALFNDPAAPVTDDYPEALWYADLLGCRRCKCRLEARRVVPGTGLRSAEFLFMGQNPGNEEDERGIPFVGPSGDELMHWMAILGLDRRKVALTNVVKCLTKGNRTPVKGEIRVCTQEWIPKELFFYDKVSVLIPLGKPAMEVVLGKLKTPGACEPFWTQVAAFGRVFHVVPLPHPAYLLRAPGKRPEVYHRLLPTVRDYLARTVPDAYERAR